MAIHNFINGINWKYLKQYFTGKISLFRENQNIFLGMHGKKYQGKILEIGSDRKQNYQNCFPNASEYLHSNISGEYDLKLDVTNMVSIESNSIDVIICISVLEHIWDYHLAIDEIERVLKPHGTFIATTPFGFPIHDKVDYWRFTDKFFIKQLDKFNIISITQLGGRLSTVVNSLQRPTGKLTLRYFIYKSIGFVIAFIAIKLDTIDSFPLGFGIIANKKNDK